MARTSVSKTEDLGSNPSRAVKERPIIFSGDMVRTILEGRKTMARRVLKRDPQMSWPADKIVKFRYDGEKAFPIFKNARERVAYEVCPYGKPGDYLWVREAWRFQSWDWEDSEVTIQYKDGKNVLWETPEEDFENYLIECADDMERAGIMIKNDAYERPENGDYPTRWRSPIHMPRWASRLTLKITDIRAERLQDISLKDAYSEGYPYEMFDPMKKDFDPPFIWFRKLWNSIHGDGAWNLNPFCWVISFQKL